MSLGRTLRTARLIPRGQLAHRARFLVLRRIYRASRERPFRAADRAATGMPPAERLPRPPDDVLWPEGLDAVERRAAAFAKGRFAYLNREADFSRGVRWHDPGASPLWRYQLQYLGSVADLARTGRKAAARTVLRLWREEFDGRWDETAWHPYPASLRLVNLCVAAACAGGFAELGPGAASLAGVHATYVLRHLERDVRGNHLLENARALLWAGRAFRGGAAEVCERTARRVLDAEVAEQVLPDGGHFELSPMYHCVVLRDLLEVRALLGEEDPLVRERISPAVERMARFLAAILCPDGDIPLLGDSARGFGPPPRALLALTGATASERPGVVSLRDSGLHVLRGDGVWAILDAGPVCPPYLPAHGQADTLTVEVWVGRTRVVADPGVHDYSGPERAWGRSSRAHSTVTIEDRDTSEVYGDFRVGGRAEVLSVAEGPGEIAATVRPYGARARITRSVRLYGASLTIDDAAHDAPSRTARSRLHLDPGAGFLVGGPAGASAAHSRAADVEATRPLRVERGRVATQFGRSEDSVLLVQEAPADGTRMRWVIGPA